MSTPGLRQSAAPGNAPAARFLGWRMVVLATFIHSCAYGVIFGGYGVSVLAIEERYGVSRATSASMLSVMVAVVIISAPLLGALYTRFSLRKSFLAGGALASFGHILLSWTDDARLMVAVYTLLVGPGVALMGSMAANVLVTRWFSSNQGKAFGVVNLPLGMMIVPVLSAEILERAGLQSLYLISGIVLLLIVPAAWALVDRPEDVGQRAEEHGNAARQSTTEPVGQLSVPRLLLRPDLWGVGVALGIIIGAATMKQAHLVPLLREQGHSLQFASTLLALTSGAGAVGSIAVGWLADRFGGLSTLIVNASLQAVMWLVFLIPASVPLLVLDAIVMGACAGGVSAAQGVLISRHFGSVDFSRALGVISLVAAPFMLGINTLTGVVHDLTGSYQEPVVIVIGCTVLAAVLLWAVSRRGNHR